MTDKEKQKRKRLPPDVRDQIKRELGTMPDQALADKYSTDALKIERHTIFYMRKQAGVPAYSQRPYTAPPFRGRLEDAHPEVAELLGKVPLVRIAEKFGVSRSCVRDAAKRLNKPTRAVDFDDVFDAATG